jgi:UDP-N-acetylmuramoyl-tripeptide--D-alanyl-D-alanine ligase
MSAELFTLQEIAQVSGGQWHKSPALPVAVSAVKTDSRDDCSNALFIALAGENFDAHDFLPGAVAAGAAALCINRKFAGRIDLSWQIPVLLTDDTLLAYQKLGAFHKNRLKGLKTVAVTGSMGKTSVKEIIRSILVAAAGPDAVHATAGNTNNQVGVPQNLLALTDKHKYAVIEMGTNHQGEIEPLSRCVRPDVAVINSIAPCHLEHLRDLNGVAREKAMIFAHLNPAGTAVVPDISSGMEIIEAAAAKFNILRFGTTAAADVRASYLGGRLRGSAVELIFKCLNNLSRRFEWPLSGAHHAGNAAAGACAAIALGIDPDCIIAGLKNCALPGMRMKISERNGVTWINDAYNANPGSMLAALRWLNEFAEQDKLILALGDMLELGDASHDEHRKVAAAALELFPHARFFFVGSRMADAVNEIKPAADVMVCEDSTEAAEKIKTALIPGKMILLKGSRGVHLEKVEPQP